MSGAMNVFPLRLYEINGDKVTVYLSIEASHFKSSPVTSSQFISIECYSSICVCVSKSGSFIKGLWIKIYDSSFTSCLLQVLPI